jgi:hypothetical protein
MEELLIRIEQLEKVVFKVAPTQLIHLPPGEYTQDEILALHPQLTAKTIKRYLALPYHRERRRQSAAKSATGYSRKIWIYSVPTEAPD